MVLGALWPVYTLAFKAHGESVLRPGLLASLRGVISPIYYYLSLFRYLRKTYLLVFHSIQSMFCKVCKVLHSRGGIFCSALVLLL